MRGQFTHKIVIIQKLYSNIYEIFLEYCAAK